MAVEAERARLRVENARLLKLLRLTPQQAAPPAPANGAWPLEHPVLASLGWLVLLLVIFVPLCSARYARA